MLGVRIGGYVKLVFIALLLVVASAINMLGDENSGGRKDSDNGLNIVVGVIAGFLKGVFWFWCFTYSYRFSGGLWI